MLRVLSTLLMGAILTGVVFAELPQVTELPSPPKPLPPPEGALPLPLGPLPEAGSLPQAGPLEEEYDIVVIAAAHLFAERGEAQHLRALLRKHPTLINAKLKFFGNRKPMHGDNYTLLHRAAEKGHTTTVKMLLDRKADLKADGGDGWTPLHVAAKSGAREIVEVLVEVGASVNALTTAQAPAAIPSGPIFGPQELSPAIPAYSPLDVANQYKRAAIAEYLQQKGAKPAKE